MKATRKSGSLVRPVEQIEIAIYDGRHLLGSYHTSKVSGFDAFDAAGKPIGKFNTAKAAADGIFEVRHTVLRRAAA